MSYGRNPYYIYSDGGNLYLDGVTVTDEVINAFLYKVLLTNRRDELKIRLKQGKEAWLHKFSYDSNSDIHELSQDSEDVKYEKLSFEMCEDEIVKELMK